MSYEWHVNFHLDLEPWDEMERRVKANLGERSTGKDIENKEKEELHPVIGGKDSYAPIEDFYARLQLLSQTIGTRTDHDANENKWNTLAKTVYADAILMENTEYNQYIRKARSHYLDLLDMSTPALTKVDLSLLPDHSFFLYIPFTLSAPYISKDDTSFYVHENPVRKDPVLRVPVVGSTSWKGSFRAALRWTLKTEDDDPQVICLLGNSKGEEKNFKRGRLSFYATFFDALEVQVINPHRRETGAGDKPIHIENVPRGAKGIFALLYTPIVPSEPDGPLPDWGEVLKDLETVGKAAYSLLGETGFGAKTAAGMGRAQKDIVGAYLVVHRWVKPIPPSPPHEEKPPEQFQPDSDKFKDKDGHWQIYETNEELKRHISGDKARSEYKRQRETYRDWQKQRVQWETWEKEIARLKDQADRELLRLDLTELKELKQLREQVEKQVKERNDE